MDKFNYACTYAYVRCTNALDAAKAKVKKRVDEVVNDESGMEIIAIILILVVVIALVIIFRKEIVALVEKIFGKIGTETDDILTNPDGKTPKTPQGQNGGVTP